MDDLEIDSSENKPKNENMGSPGSGGKAGKIVFILIFISILVMIIFTGEDSEKVEAVDDIVTEEISNEDRQGKGKESRLKIPKEKKISLKEKLKKNSEVEIEKKVAPIKDATASAKVKRLFTQESKIRQDLLKEKQKAQEQMNRRRQARMSTSNTSSASASKLRELENNKNMAESLRDKILGGGMPNTRLTGASNSNKKTDGQLLSMPVSETLTVKAENLTDIEYLLTEGTVMQATLESAINSNLPGKIRAIINTPVYSYTGNAKLVDKTSEVIGEYRNASDGGEPRIFVIWTRLLTSDGISIRLDSPGIDAIGRSGVGGWTDTHFMKRFGSSVLLSIIGGVTQSETDSSNQSQAISNSFNKSAEIALERSINIKPTVKLNQGQRVAIFVNKDISFADALSARKVKRLENKSNVDERISYDRVFNEKPMSSKERALLGNRFIQDRKLLAGQSYMQKPYTGEGGESLRAVFKRWSERNNYKLNWIVKDIKGNTVDWKLATDMTIHGTLHDVINRVLTAYERAGVKIKHQFFEENQVLEVKGNFDEE